MELARLAVDAVGWDGQCRMRNLTSAFLSAGSRKRAERKQLTAPGYPARNVVIVEAVDSFEVPATASVYRDSRMVSGEGDSYIWPGPAHWTSSTTSKLLWTMNWFIWRACSANRATPSPPCFAVPNSYSKRGLSCVPIMAK